VGEPLSVVLVWQLRQPLSQPLSAFVHLSAGEGAPVAQSDGPPAWPWPTDATIVDRRTIETAGVPAGTYNLVVGLYDPSSGARLLLPDGADSLVIGEAVLVVP